MIIGKLCSCKEKEYYDCIPSIESMILHACDGYDFPIIENAPFGHDLEKTVFQYGAEVSLSMEEH